MMTRQPAVTFNQPRSFWFERHPTALNWLALGVLLAAWNAVDNDASGAVHPPAIEPRAMQPRPAALRGYTPVSVRALTRVTALRG
jgi:hypothetical protein